MTPPEVSTRTITMPIGVIVRRAPGQSRWARWVWSVTGLLPGAGPGNWQELATTGETTDYHAATVPLTLHRADTEAYLTSLNGNPPSLFVILRSHGGSAEARPEVLTVTASAYEAQDYADNGEDIVERVPMAEALQAWIGRFVEKNHHDTPFKKRKRRPHFDPGRQDGIGDPRIAQPTDVYRAPGASREGDE